MTYSDIQCFALINDVDTARVDQLAESMKNNGFVGCPILVFGDQLLTGSHRLAALKKLQNEGEIFVEDWEVAEDITEIVNDSFESYYAEHGFYPDLDYSDIGWILSGTCLEKYKNEMEEW